MEKLSDKKLLKAVVFGGTGATGKHLVWNLLNMEQVGQVFVVGRSPYQLPEFARDAHEYEKIKTKLEQFTHKGIVQELSASHLACQKDHKDAAVCGETTPVVFGSQATEVGLHLSAVERELLAKVDLKSADIVFCAIGTTREAAGSVDNFKDVDLNYASRIISLSSFAQVPVLSLVSATGSNAKMWACNAKIFHGLLYTKVKGLVEDHLVQCKFPHAQIYKPGLLDRRTFIAPNNSDGNAPECVQGEASRPLEKMFGYLVNSLSVNDLSKAMIYNAMRASTAEKSKPVFFANKEIKRDAAAFNKTC